VVDDRNAGLTCFGTRVVVSQDRVRILISNTHKRPQLARSLIEYILKDAWRLKTIVEKEGVTRLPLFSRSEALLIGANLAISWLLQKREVEAHNELWAELPIAIWVCSCSTKALKSPDTSVQV
jgi:hypothetical protein